MSLKPCPHCNGKEFEKLPDNYGLINMNNEALDETGLFGNHTNLLPLTVSICKSCDHLALSFNHEAGKN